MAKLLIVGDSFAAEPPKGDEYKPWFKQAGELLDLEIENYAMIGVSQDWCFWKRQNGADPMTCMVGHEL